MAIMTLKKDNIPGPNMVSNDMLCNLTKECGDVMLCLFNTTWSPSQWKTAEIITVPKPGKYNTRTKSYRPISLLLYQN